MLIVGHPRARPSPFDPDRLHDGCGVLLPSAAGRIEDVQVKHKEGLAALILTPSRQPPWPLLSVESVALVHD